MAREAGEAPRGEKYDRSMVAVKACRADRDREPDCNQGLLTGVRWMTGIPTTKMVSMRGRRRRSEDFLEATLPALDLVYNLARRLVDADDVEDVAQETFARAYDAWVRGRTPRKVEPWLATICLNVGRSWLRRASTRREVPSEPDPMMESEIDVSSEAIINVRRAAVHHALWKLPEEQRIAIALMDLDGFTAAQVARMTGSPRGTVLARVHRGRKKLAHMLAREVDSVET